MKTNNWVDIDRVESDSEPGVEHVIQRHRVTGTIRCPCKSYQFSHAPKTCKHVQASIMAQAVIDQRPIKTTDHQETIRVKQNVVIKQKGKMPVEREEYFTVRRAFAVGGAIR